MTDYYQVIEELKPGLATLREQSSEVLSSFSKLGAAATKSKVLDEKNKELIAMGISVSTRCDGCIAFHARNLVKLGATEAELIEAVGVAIYMGGGPSLMYAAKAVEAFRQFSND